MMPSHLVSSRLLSSGFILSEQAAAKKKEEEEENEGRVPLVALPGPTLLGLVTKGKIRASYDDDMI